ncbi:ADP-ribosylglycohydrolase family protein [Pedosphaera parvula]|nr:ADP-ribosylglycohydrolase family protein [Pedosphaera parvula]
MENETSVLPPDHPQQLDRALLSLEGLSAGDAFGQCFFCDRLLVEGRLEGRHAPPAPWFFTDDTVMAISIVRNLQQYGGINQDALAGMFVSEYVKDPRRGYGGTAHSILQRISNGVSWQLASREVFDGMGSMGNGGAMRAAPIGAYFADDISKAIEHARLSAEVTHAHAEGQAGAIAIAVAAAWAFTHRDKPNIGNRELIEYVADHTP